MKIRDVTSLTPFASGLEYSAPARGPWNIVHLGMLIPESHQIFTCAQGCLRGVVLTAAEMGAMDRFSTVAITQDNLLDGDMEQMVIDGVSEILDGMAKKPRALLLFTSCMQHFAACDLAQVFSALRKAYPSVDFTDCYMTPILRKRITPDALMRRQLYSLLRPLPRAERQLNFLGNALPVDDGGELSRVIRGAGWRAMELCKTRTYDEYLKMASSSLNVTTIPAAMQAGEALKDRLDQTHLNMPFAYDFGEIRRGYEALCQALGCVTPDFSEDMERAESALRDAQKSIGSLPVSIDYTATTRPMELARLLTGHSFAVEKLFADAISPEDAPSLKWLRTHAPDIELLPTVQPQSGLLAHETHASPCLAIGQKAAYFTGTRHFVNLVEGGSLYGYHGAKRLAQMMKDAAAYGTEPKKIIQIKGWGCCG